MGLCKQHVGELYVVGVDVGFFGECDFGWFFVRAFAEADADAFGDELLDVGLGAKRYDWMTMPMEPRNSGWRECGGRCRA